MHTANALLTIAQMADADRATIASGLSGPELMRNAGDAVVREITRRWSARPVAVLCGPGNNGGDGFVVAVSLASAGWPVRLALLGDRDKLPEDARHHAMRWAGPIEPITPAVLAGACLVVDAVFGSGFKRSLPPDVAATLAQAAERGLPLIAIDVPSGVRGDSGEAPSAEAPAAGASDGAGRRAAAMGAVRATCTVTFARKKPGHALLPGRELCGEIVVAEIGMPSSIIESLSIDSWENDPAVWLQHWPRPQSSGNKYTRGHALLLGGYPMTGAARMAARAAARAGAGLTTIAVSETAFLVYAAALTSIMVQPLAQPEDFSRLLADRRYSAFLIGPGAGVNDTTRDRAIAMLGTARGVILDADAITVFAGRLPELVKAVRGPCVMTPHEGEFARLFDPAGDKLTRARNAARHSGAIIVLKGADTVIAAPDGRVIINTNAPATLATAGSGDVLGGFILGLLAQHMEPFMAAAAGVWMHGAAAAEFGPGLMAEDLPDLLPAVLRRLESMSRS